MIYRNAPRGLAVPCALRAGLSACSGEVDTGSPKRNMRQN
jgi:hypothetical protein